MSKTLTGLFFRSITIVVGLMIGGAFFATVPAYAADGSGTNTVTPTSTDISTTGNTFTFTFTAAETMDSGGISITTPSGWSSMQGTNGTAGYTTVSTTGMVADVEDTADSATGWSAGTACSGTGGAPAADTSVHHEGSASIRCINANESSGDKWYKNITSENWAGFTKVGFWIRTNVALTSGQLQFSYDDTANLASPLENLSIPAISVNTWTYVPLSFGATTRTAVISYGFRSSSNSAIDNKTIYIDDILLGPGSPTFASGVINTRILQLANTQTITTTYGSGGGTSGVTAPATAGTYTATTTSRFDDSGTLTDIASQPTLGAKYPLPTLTSISPTSVTVNASGFTMNATGTNFVTGQTVLQFNGSARTTTVDSATALHATINASDLTTVGAFNITVFNPTPGGGTSAAQTFTVNKANATISLGSTANPSTYGGSVTFTATTTGSAGTPSGTVTFKDGGVSIATSTLSGGVATLATSTLSVGSHSITAVYNGDSNYNASTSAALPQTVNKANITIALGSSLNPSTYGGTVIFTATTTSGVGTPSGTVTFFDGVTSLGTSTLSLGVTTLATSSLAVGTHSITAVYNGDTNFNASTSATMSQVVNKANITITLGSSLNPSTYGSTVTFTATTTSGVGIPSGTVTFKDGGVSIATSTLFGGVATLATSTLSVGSRSITAVYNGDSNYNASTSAALSQTVNKANITIALGSSLNPSTYGDSVTFTATTTSAAGTPSGTATFFDGATAIGTSTLSSGVATLSTSTLSIGSHSITAVYNGDTNFNASTSAAVPQVVNKANITITLGSSLNPSAYGDSVTFTATTTSVVGIPSGTVTFKDGGVSIATSTLSSGVATLSTSTLTVGTHSITAVYNGDTTYNASTSVLVSQVVNKANITITLGSSLNPSTYSDTVTFTATTTSAAGTPSGTVTFKDGGVSIVTSALSGGVATLSTSTLTVGTHSITAVYNGDTNFSASSSAAVSQVVNKASITITLASSLNPSTYGDSVTFTATTTGGFGTPSGTVTFKDGGVSIATSTLTAGVATLSTSTLSVAMHSITATYNGDTNHNASTSAAVSQTVNKANITITLASSLNPSTYGQMVAFTATTTAVVGIPSGTVTFFDGATAIGDGVLTGGVATFATSTLSMGTHSITATYNGDTNFNASTSAVVSQVVNKANITISLGSSINPSTYGDSVTFTATTTGGFGTPSGTVTFFDGVTSIGTSTLSSSIATLSTSILTVGVHSITATYNGDTNYNASTSAAVSQTVNKANIAITLASSANPSTYGDIVTFTATTTATVGIPSGTVTFKDGLTSIATSALTNGVATLATSTLAVGIHSITAVYNGDTNFNASTSAAVSQTISEANITITLGSSLNPSTYGDTVTFTATTTGGFGTPSGTVTFKDDSTTLATSTMSGGVATFATSALSAGTHSITAIYNGDSNYNASTSAAVSQVVNNPTPTITLLSPNTIEEGSATTSLTISGTGFIASSTVVFNGTSLAISSQSSTTIDTSIPASLLASFSTSTVAVTNPTPGGGTASSSFIVTRSAVKFVIIDPTDGTVDGPITVTVQAQKADNSVSINYQQDVTLNVSGSAKPTSVLVNIVNGIGTTSISDTVAEAVNLSLTDSQSTGIDISSTQQVVFAPGATAKFTIAGPATLDAGNRAPITATRKDQFNNLVTSGPDTTAYFYTSSTSTSKVFYSAPVGNTIASSAIIASGTSTVTVWYYDETPGAYAITVSDNASAPDGITGIDDATTTLTVQAVATRFVIIDPTDGTVDGPITVTVQAQDNLGRIDGNYQNKVTLLITSTSSQATTTANGLVDIVNGVGTLTISDTVAETAHLWLTDTQGTGLNVASSTQDVIFAPGTVAQFVFGPVTNTPQNTRLQIDVARKDQFGNYVLASSTPVYFYASPTTTANNFYDAPTGGTQTNLTTITSGNASSSIWLGGDPLGALGTFTITASDNATAPDGTAGIDDVSTSTTVTPVATQLAIIDPTDGTVDAPVTVNVQARDDNNNVVTSYNGSATLAVSGSATLSNSGTITFADGVATTTLHDTVAPETVTISIIASSTALRATSTQNVLIGVGALSQFTLTDPGNTVAGTLVEYTATRKDQYGNMITAGSLSADILVSPTTTPGVFYASNSTSSAQLTTVQFDNGSATKQFWYYNEKVGTYQLTVQSGSAVGSDSIIISSAAVAKLTMNDRISTNPASRLEYTIVRKDQFNNLVTSGSLPVYMYADPISSSTTFYDAAIGGTAGNAVTIGDTQSSANVWYYETQVGSYTITASDNATAPDGALGLLDATDSVSVQVATATQFVFASVVPQSLGAGNASVVTIEARDDYGNLDTSYQKDVTLVTGVNSATGAGLSAGTALIDIVNGIGSITLTDNIAETVNLALTDSQSTGLGVSAVSSIVWNPGPTAQFSINDPGDIVAGNRIGYTVNRKDQYGNYVNAGSDTVYLYSDSLGTHKAFYASLTASSTAQFVTITAGATSTNFWYYDEAAGAYTITASDNATAPDGTVGIDDATDQLIISAAPIVATRYEIIDPSDVAIGQNTVVVIQTQDNAGALDNTQQGDVYLKLSTSSVAVAGMVNNEVLVHIANGIGTVTLTDSVIETIQLSLRLPAGSTSTLSVASTQDVAFLAAAPTFVGGGGGGYIPPQPVATFTGRAYPGAKVVLFARTAAGDIPLQQDVAVAADGTFKIDFSGALKGLEAFGLSILDDQGRVSQTKIYDMNKITAVTAEKNLYIAPTVGIVQRTVTVGNNVGLTGSAAPGSIIKAEVDGKSVDAQIQTGKDGSYGLLINTKDLAYGGHVVRLKQVDKNGVESDYSVSKVFTVSKTLNTRADLNNNGGIDIGDWSIFLTDFASTNPDVRKQVDLNGDGKVDISDFSMFIRSTVGR